MSEPSQPSLLRVVLFESCFLEVTIIDIDPEQLSAVVHAVSKNFTYEGCKEIYSLGKGLVYYLFMIQQ